MLAVVSSLKKAAEGVPDDPEEELEGENEAAEEEDDDDPGEKLFLAACRAMAASILLPASTIY